jgi:hypothetical protein
VYSDVKKIFDTALMLSINFQGFQNLNVADFQNVGGAECHHI